MIVVFIIVLVVFGPHKLPELARGLGKLMAEFRKASTDFKGAFEQEMRDLERQAFQAEQKKTAEAAAAMPAVSANAPDQSASQPAGAPSEAEPSAPETLSAETPVISPVAESVPRSLEAVAEGTIEKPAAVTEPSQDPAHDHQQPA